MGKYILNTTLQHSKRMSKVKSKNTKPEILFRKALYSIGIRYRLNVAKLPGKPDIVINKHKLIIFIDGDFWHGYNWEKNKLRIKSNTEFWISKIEKNMKRDIENNIALQNIGYNVIRFWEHDIKKDLKGCISLVVSLIDSNTYKI